MEPIPVRIRERIVALYDEGETTAEIAGAFGYSPAAVRRVRQHHRERGTLEPRRPAVGRKSGLTGPVEAAVRAAAVSTVDRWLARLGLTRKKSRRRPPSRTGRT